MQKELEILRCLTKRPEKRVLFNFVCSEREHRAVPKKIPVNAHKEGRQERAAEQ
jgi:hypothetical protein